MLRRLQLVRKLEACLDGPPGHEAERVELLVCGSRGPPRARLVGELGHDALREVPRPRPRLVLVAHDGAGQAFQRRHRREHLHHARPALDLPVRTLLQVVGAQALPVAGREVEVGQRVGLGLLELCLIASYLRV